jgi:biopolymer transport protein ExbD
MGMSGGQLDGQPMNDMNMTPLIDVLLVLLIMFIITIPVANHAISVDLPQGNPPPTDLEIDLVKNKLNISQDDVIYWNAEAITPEQLVSTLARTKAMKPEPELQYEPERFASYDLSAKVLQIIKASGVTKFGFVGNDRYRDFGKAGS